MQCIHMLHRATQVYYKRDDTPNLRQYHEQLQHIKYVVLLYSHHAAPTHVETHVPINTHTLHLMQVTTTWGAIWACVALSVIF